MSSYDAEIADGATVREEEISNGPLAWTSVFAVALGIFAFVTAEFLPVGLLTEMASDLGVSEGKAGLMVTMPGVTAAFMAPILTVITGRLDRRTVLCILIVLLLLSNLLTAVASDFVIVLIGRFFLGMGLGGFWAIGAALGPRLVQRASAGKATSIIFAGIYVGSVAGVPLGTFLGNAFGWRLSFGVSAAVSAILLLLLFAVMPKLPPLSRIRWSDLPALLNNRAARSVLSVAILVFFGYFAAYTYVTPLLVQISGLEPNVVAIVLVGSGIAGFFGNLLGGWAVNRGYRRPLLVAIALMFVAIGLLPMTHGQPFAAVALVCLWGAAYGPIPMLLQSWVLDAASRSMESGSALYIGLVQAAVAAGSLAGGLLMDATGISATIYSGAITIGCALIATYALAPQGR